MLKTVFFNLNHGAVNINHEMGGPNHAADNINHAADNTFHGMGGPNHTADNINHAAVKTAQMNYPALF